MSDLKTARGHDRFKVASALQKAVRRSDLDAAVYWAVELHESGQGWWLWHGADDHV